MQKLIFFFLILIFPIALFAEGLVYVDPLSQEVNSSASFTVTIYLQDGVDVTGAGINIGYDNQVLQYNSASQGNYFSGFSTFYQSNILSGDKTLQVDQAILGGGSKSTTGSLFTITFTPLKAGTTAITINTAFINSSEPTFTHTTQSGSVTVLLEVELKVFAQGPYNNVSGEMPTTLNSADELPLTQPFDQSPWNYAGSEAVSSGFFSSQPDIVDWALVELRSNTTTTIESKAGFLLKDGSVVGTDGSSSLFFEQNKSSYYIVVKSRNHLPIMTSSAQALDLSSNLYDFSTAQSKAYGTNPMIALGDGSYGMIAGDVNSDGVIDATDRSAVWNNRLVTGYINSDVNFDGVVDATDRSIIWNNRLLQTNVP